jgi:hypothetical protein
VITVAGPVAVEAVSESRQSFVVPEVVYSVGFGTSYSASEAAVAPMEHSSLEAKIRSWATIHQKPPSVASIH